MRRIDADALLKRWCAEVCKPNPNCNEDCTMYDYLTIESLSPTIDPEPQWILCSERLPGEHIGFYLVTVQKRRITALNVVGCDNTVHDIDIARWDYDRRTPQRGYHWCKADKVIAWMPLPEPYKEGEQNED